MLAIPLRATGASMRYESICPPGSRGSRKPIFAPFSSLDTCSYCIGISALEGKESVRLSGRQTVGAAAVHPHLFDRTNADDLRGGFVVAVNLNRARSEFLGDGVQVLAGLGNYAPQLAVRQLIGEA